VRIFPGKAVEVKSVAVCCSALQLVAFCCSVLQRVADTAANVIGCRPFQKSCVLQRVTACCSKMKRVAACC